MSLPRRGHARSGPSAAHWVPWPSLEGLWSSGAVCWERAGAALRPRPVLQPAVGAGAVCPEASRLQGDDGMGTQPRGQDFAAPQGEGWVQ